MTARKMATQEDPKVLRSLFLPRPLDSALRQMCLRRSQSISEWVGDAIQAAQRNPSASSSETPEADPDDNPVRSETGVAVISDEPWPGRIRLEARMEAGDEEGELTQEEIVAALLAKISTLRSDLEDALEFAGQISDWRDGVVRKRDTDAGEKCVSQHSPEALRHP